MCKLLKVNRSAYYHWISNGCIINKVDEQLNQLIKDIFYQYREVYGTRRIKEALVQEYGVIVSTRKIAKCMNKLGISVKMKRKFKVTTTDSNHNYSISPNRLQRDFRTNVANEVYGGDITYIRTQQGWLYLAVVMDLYSRRIVGWSMSRRINRHLVLNALNMALGQRRVEGELIHHSDRGAQYLSDDFQALLKKHGISCSLSGAGSCYDNAVVESFFATLKRERVKRRKYRTRDQARADVFDYIERFYNRQRRHGYVGNISPVEFEEKTIWV